ncbi:LPXTG cell wall anchor domain-containing protein [Paucilactobacillus nenjiangensis]|uniref:LPXTG cell wall anchor domain-containing protein n=1 Tax=Paucilactobacillus nenjiangensis TaxID=1296540 RepID=UPI0028D90C8B|nr:LPXTG cell wall anchor domain-containing protein [Paucilactobacillus nenjiangensis]
MATTPAKSSVKEAPVTSASVLPQTDDSSSQTGLWGAILLAMTNLLVLLKLRRTVKAKAKKK